MLPYQDYKEIEEVPTVAQIRAGMKDKAVRQNFHHTFQSENDQKYVLDLFLMYNF